MEQTKTNTTTLFKPEIEGGKEWYKCSGSCGEEYNELYKDGFCRTCWDAEQKKKKPLKTFDNFNASDKEVKAVNRVKNFITEHKGVYLFGPAGVGKTHLAQALYSQAERLSRYYNMPELMLTIRETFGSRRGMTERDIIDECTAEKYLFLDDFGAEKLSDFTIETIYLILDRAIRNGSPKLFITSNYNIKELAERMTDRISSRIVGLCDIVKLDGKDYRVGK